MNTLCFWSGGKDSTASIILAHIHKLPITEIVFCEVMFDKSRNISGEIPEHIDFIRNTAIPIFEEWGYKIKILRADCDYMDLFFHTVTRSKTEENNGKNSGWLIGGRCAGNDRLKMKPIRQYRKSIEGEYIEYVGIAADEPKRLERLTDNKRSLLYEYNCTEEMAYELCKNYGLLSPIYSFTRRNGCWFCPNQSYNELAHECEDSEYNNNSRSKKRKVRERQLPGVSPLVYSRFLIESAVFLSLNDMGKDLPDYEEIPVELSLSPEIQEEYDRIEGELLHVMRYDKKAARKVLSKYLQLTLTYPDQPYGHEAILYPLGEDREPIVIPKDTAKQEDLSEKDLMALDIVERKVKNGERIKLKS